jgi:hypothetical protein
MPTFQNFPDAIAYGQKLRKRTQEEVIYVLVHTHRIAVYRGGWCHAGLYQVQTPVIKLHESAQGVAA